MHEPAHGAGFLLLPAAGAPARRSGHRGLLRRRDRLRPGAVGAPARRERLLPRPPRAALVGHHAVHRGHRNVGPHRDLDPRDRRPRRPHLPAARVRLPGGADRRRRAPASGLFRRHSGHRLPAAGAPLRGWGAGKLVTLDFTPSFKVLYTFWGGVLGGALLAGASHGTDHLIVQRLLAARGLKDAQRALIGSGAFIIAQFALFLLVGTSLWL